MDIIHSGSKLKADRRRCLTPPLPLPKMKERILERGMIRLKALF
jgi:hypothetical protein